jgi:hypothetical protein
VRRALTVLALLGAVVALLASAAPVGARPDAGRERARVAAKKKPVRCTRAQTQLTVKRRVRCAKLPAAKPNADLDLELFSAAIRREPAPAHDKRGRRVPKFWQGAGGRLKKIQTRLLKVLPKALALSRRTATARASAAGTAVSCGDLERANLPDQTASGDGFTFTATAGGDVNMSVSAGSGYRVDVILTGQQACSNLELPQCPTPDGTLDGKDAHSSVVGLRVTKDGAVVKSFRTAVVSTQTMRGHVGVDAKLDTLEFSDTARETSSYQVSGLSFGLAVGIQGSANVKMRTGAIENATVRANFSAQGFAVSDGIAATDRAASAYAQRFPDLVREERDHYRERERAWQTPGACAKLVFDPPTDTIKVPKGKPGTLNAHVEANAGGTATKAKWTLSGQEKGTFSPAEVESPSPSFSYTPTGEDHEKIKADLRATSTAGVAEGPWRQEIQGSIEHIRGTIQGSIVESRLDGDSRLDWQGNAAFDLDPSSLNGNRLFKTASGDYTVTASGVGSYGCTQSGTKQFMLSAGDGSLFIPNLTTDPAPPPPYQYSFGAGVAGPTQPTIDVLLSSCPDKANNGKTDTIPAPVVYDSNGFRTSSDGIDFSGSWSETKSTTTEMQSWSFHGTP